MTSVTSTGRQGATTAGSNATAPAQKTVATGRAVLLLAVAVVLGVVLLQGIDESELTGSDAAAPAGAPTDAQNDAITSNPSTLAQPVRPPSQVKVLVANGVGVSGAASKVAGRLQPAGYELMKPGNTVNREEASGIQFAPGFGAEAQALAISLGLPPISVQPLANPAPVSNLQGSNVVVIVGNDLANAAVNTANQAPAPAAGVTNTPGASPLSGPLTSSQVPPATLPNPAGVSPQPSSNVPMVPAG